MANNLPINELFHSEDRGEFMTLDEAIAHAREVAEEQRKACDLAWVWDNPDNIKKCAEEHDQLAEWLEELKFLKQWKSDIMDSFCKYDVSSFEELVTNVRNKTIDDYMNKLCNHCMQQTNECYKLECPFCTDGCDIVNIAEESKAGITND